MKKNAVLETPHTEPIVVHYGARTARTNAAPGTPVMTLRINLTRELGHIPENTPVLLDGTPAAQTDLIPGTIETVEFLQPASQKG